MGGCTFTAHAVFGRPGNNPYCHYRARTLASAGRRERLVPKTAAPGTPFDNGPSTSSRSRSTRPIPARRRRRRW